MKHRLLKTLLLVIASVSLYSDGVFQSAMVEQLTEPLAFTEGPVWNPETQEVIFSSIPQSRLYAWSEEGGLRIFRENTNKANGNILDREGRLISCEGGAKRVTRLEHDGTLTVLADTVEGKEFNSPNDVAVGKDGSVYFTDPNFGRKGEGEEQQFVYVIIPDGTVEKALPSSFNKPNGIAVSLDQKTLYVNEGANHWTLAYELLEDGRVNPESRRVASGLDKTLDGLAVHPETGDLYIAVFTNNRNKPDEQGINVFTAKGAYKGMIPIPGNTTNVCFGENSNILYVTSGGKLYRVRMGED